MGCGGGGGDANDTWLFQTMRRRSACRWRVEGGGGETADEALAVLLDGAEDELLLHVAQLIDRY